jgi:hypothetical protein
MGKKGLHKICWGEVKRGEKDVSPSPSKGHQAWNLPRATKHSNLARATKHYNLPLVTKQDASPLATKLGTFQGAPSCGLPSPPSFSFFLKARIWIIWCSLFRHNFRFQSLKTYSYIFPWEEKSEYF